MILLDSLSHGHWLQVSINTLPHRDARPSWAIREWLERSIIWRQMKIQTMEGNIEVAMCYFQYYKGKGDSGGLWWLLLRATGENWTFLLPVFYWLEYSKSHEGGCYDMKTVVERSEDQNHQPISIASPVLSRVQYVLCIAKVPKKGKSQLLRWRCQDVPSLIPVVTSYPLPLPISS